MLSVMLEWTYSGVNTSVAGAGGAECVNYLSNRQRIYETFLVTAVFSYLCSWSWPRLCLPPRSYAHRPRPALFQTLLFLHSLIFGIEIGFKLASKSLIWVLNPCHVLTMMQLFLLAAQPSNAVTALFRLQMHMLNGPLLALAFPVLNTRQVCAFCVFSVEPLDDLSWSVFSLSLQVLYHFLVLQPISMVSRSSLSNFLHCAYTLSVHCMHKLKIIPYCILPTSVTALGKRQRGAALQMVHLLNWIT
ncbi:unnamed protein product [Echinostoma caproni]|uniref:Transmembrane protein 164 n=1 Tax=Echinostoma caproni TaxID=27848 RepID=A0A3P8L9N8_9TREM|nr:unnamed protein product [Echinostoma caproni]